MAIVTFGIPVVGGAIVLLVGCVAALVIGSIRRPASMARRSPLLADEPSVAHHPALHRAA